MGTLKRRTKPVVTGLLVCIPVVGLVGCWLVQPIDTEARIDNLAASHMEFTLAGPLRQGTDSAPRDGGAVALSQLACRRLSLARFGSIRLTVIKAWDAKTHQKLALRDPTRTLRIRPNVSSELASVLLGAGGASALRLGGLQLGPDARLTLDTSGTGLRRQVMLAVEQVPGGLHMAVDAPSVGFQPTATLSLQCTDCRLSGLAPELDATGGTAVLTAVLAQPDTTITVDGAEAPLRASESLTLTADGSADRSDIEIIPDNTVYVERPVFTTSNENNSCVSGLFEGPDQPAYMHYVDLDPEGPKPVGLVPSEALFLAEHPQSMLHRLVLPRGKGFFTVAITGWFCGEPAPESCRSLYQDRRLQRWEVIWYGRKFSYLDRWGPAVLTTISLIAFLYAVFNWVRALWYVKGQRSGRTGRAGRRRCKRRN